jgi:TolA-binding protein
MSGPDHNQAPQRLSRQEGPLGRLLAAAAEDAGAVPASARARVWRGLEAPAKPFFARPAFALGGLATACGAALLLLWARPAQGPPNVPVAVAAAPLGLSVIDGALAATSASGVALAAAAPLTDGARISAGAGGALLRSGGAQLALSAGARATLRQAGDAIEVWLDSGEAAVGSGSAASSLQRVSLRVVAAGAFRVEAPPGALFVVSASAERSVVYAVRGEAQVRTSTAASAVAPGGSWTSAGAAPAASDAVRSLADRASGEPRAAAVAPSPATEALPPPPIAQAAAPLRPSRLLARAAESAAAQGAASEDAALARANALEAAGDNAGAAAALEELSRKPGPRAEAALYELGRLRLRYLGQPAQALAAFEEHARRFPAGALSLESGLSAVEARLLLGQDEPALREMDAFLGRYGQSERAADVRWLRASLLQGRGDCRRAVPDLRTLAASGSRAEGALFLLATCARSGGDLSEARQRLQEYQRRYPDGAHRSEVDAALRGEEGR